MSELFGNPNAVAREIQGQFLHGRDKIVPPPKFGAVCKLLWPDKTAAHVASIAGKDERTAKRWLSGEFEPPVIVVLAVMQKMFEREA
jgi:hypothetical protein